MSIQQEQAIIGCILGTAIGDALGLPYEGLAPTRAAKLLGRPDRFRFWFGRGMVSDDTEHTCMVAQSLLESGDSAERFVGRFANRLRWWLLAIPAGVGSATARSCGKLWLGFSPPHTGVFSAGNGPAMRAAILGATIEDVALLSEFVRASSRLTHSDPKAEYGALAVALAARESAMQSEIRAEKWLAQLIAILPSEATDFVMLLQSAVASVSRSESTSEFAKSLGLDRGVTGYTYHTVPVAIHSWLTHPHDFRAAVTAAIECGGDADTTAAIVGGIVGSGVGAAGIPDEWQNRLWEWPRTLPWMKSLGVQLASSWPIPTPMTAPRVSTLAVLVRNLLFLGIVLGHGLRRLGPPY